MALPCVAKICLCEGEARFQVMETLLAGHVTQRVLGVGQCMRIMTGARMPNGADTVVIKERVRVEANIAVIGAGERQGSNVRPRGEEMLAGQLAVGVANAFARPMLLCWPVSEWTGSGYSGSRVPASFPPEMNW